MPYLPGFACDIFISYAHANDKEGWVTHFHAALQDALDGLMEGVVIWRDEKKLNSNTRFDTEIEGSVKGAALFLALVSGRYLESKYCQQELGWFHQKAQREDLGLSPNNQNRIFSVLLNNIPYQEWPAELAGITGLDCYDEFGFPLAQAEKDFSYALKKLAREIEHLLKGLKKLLQVPPAVAIETTRAASPGSSTNGTVASTPEKTPAFTVFLANVSDTLEEQHERLQHDLARQNIRVIAGIPPPFAATEHDARVRAALQEADLTVHLLAEAPGQTIYDFKDADGQPLKKTYAHRQIELGLEAARPQLIWLPPELKLEELESTRQRDFLTWLVEGEQQRPANSRLARPPKSNLLQVIVDEVDRLKQTTHQPPPLSAALLNFHLKDRQAAWRLSEFLDEHGVLPFIEPELNDPQQTLRILEERIKQVNRLIFLYGSNDRGWINNRFWELLKIASTFDCMPKACGICFVPPRRKEVDGGFRFPITIPVCEFDSQDLANPALLKPLLETA